MTLYHAFSNPSTFNEINEKIAVDLAKTGKPQIVCMDGSNAKLVPHPDEPYKVE